MWDINFVVIKTEKKKENRGNMMNKDKKILTIGHRGAGGIAPENTIASFKKAISYGIDAVELDVHCCKTGELVVMHDDTVDRTTDCSGKIADLSFTDLKKCDAGSGEKIPTLEEVFQIVNRQCIIDIELKGPQTGKPVGDLINIYVSQKGWNFDDFMVTSFKQSLIDEFCRYCPSVLTGLIVTTLLPQYVEKINEKLVVVNKSSVAKALVFAVHKAHKMIFVYNANTADEIKKFKDLDVDGICTDYPNLFTEGI